MAITAANLTFGVGSGLTATTASISPSANNLLICTVTGGGGNTQVPSVTGAGLTWALIGSYFDGGPSTGGRGVHQFRAMSASPGTGTLTVDFTPTSQTFIAWTVNQFSGVDTTGSNGAGAIVQFAGNTVGGTNTGITVPLSALASANNAGYGYVRNNALAAIVPGTGMTGLSDDGNGEESEWGINAPLPLAWTWASQANVAVAAAIEIKAAGAAAISGLARLGFRAIAKPAGSSKPAGHIELMSRLGGALDPPGALSGRTILAFDRQGSRPGTIAISGRAALAFDRQGRPSGLSNYLGAFTVATLPASPARWNTASAVDGIAVGDVSSAESGCPVYFNGGWLTFSADAPVIAGTGGGGGGAGIFSGSGNYLGAFTVATLPVSPPQWSTASATTGLAVGDASGAESGCPVYFNSVWRTFSDDAPVAAGTGPGGGGSGGAGNNFAGAFTVFFLPASPQWTTAGAANGNPVGGPAGNGCPVYFNGVWRTFSDDAQVVGTGSAGAALASRALLSVWARTPTVTSVPGTTNMSARALLSVQAGFRVGAATELADGIAVIQYIPGASFIAAIGGRTRLATKQFLSLGAVHLLSRLALSLEGRAIPRGTVSVLSKTGMALRALNGPPALAGAIFGRAIMISLRALALPPRGSLALTARAVTQAKASAAGKLLLILGGAAARLSTFARVLTPGAANLAGHVTGILKSLAAPAGNIKLLARGQIELQAQAAPAGKFAAAARASLALMARGVLATPGLIFLAGRSILALALRSGVSVPASMSARAMLAAQVRAASAAATGLSGRAQLESQLRASPAGKLLIAARSILAIAARVTYSSLGQIALTARSMLALTSFYGPPVGGLSLLSRAMMAFRSLAGAAGSTALSGRTPAQTNSGTAAGNFSLALRGAVAKVAGFGRAAPFGVMPLAARTIAALRSIPGAIFPSGLSGRVNLGTQARTAPGVMLAAAARAALAGVARGVVSTATAANLAARAILSTASRAQSGASTLLSGRAALQTETAGLAKFFLSLAGRAAAGTKAAASPTVLLALAGRAITSMAANVLPFGRARLAAITFLNTTGAGTFRPLGFISLFAGMFLSATARVFGLTSLAGSRIVRLDGDVTAIIRLEGRINSNL